MSPITILEILLGQSRIFQKSKCHSSTVTHFIIGIIQASRFNERDQYHLLLLPHFVNLPSQKNTDALLDRLVVHIGTKFAKSVDSSGTNNGVFQNDSVVNVTNVLCRRSRLGTFNTEHMQNAYGKLGKFTIFDKLTEMRESYKKRAYEILRSIPPLFPNAMILPASLLSEMYLTISKIASTTVFLKS